MQVAMVKVFDKIKQLLVKKKSQKVLFSFLHSCPLCHVDKNTTYNNETYQTMCLFCIFFPPHFLIRIAFMWSTQTHVCAQCCHLRIICTNDPANISAPSGVVWPSASGYSFYSAPLCWITGRLLNDLSGTQWSCGGGNVKKNFLENLPSL